MSDLINREELLKHQYCIDDSASLSTRDVVNVEDIEDCPPADLLEYARAMKEYCEKYTESCEGCPFKSKKVDVWCELGASTLPCDWDLPEGEKE